MNRILVWQLALRYLRGKRAGNAVPILSRISIVSIAITTAAMVLLLSVFNGFAILVKDLYKAFYPEIKITAERGKFFSFDEAQLAKVAKLPGVAYASRSIEDNVLLNANDEQRVATVKGVDEHFFDVNDVKPYVFEGSDSVTSYPKPTAIIGVQIMNEMGADINNVFSVLTLFYPNAESQNLALAPEQAFQSLRLKPEGVFRIQDEFDSKYILAPLEAVQYLFKADGKYSSVELKLTPGANAEKVRAELQRILGSSFHIATRFEQNRTMYMVMRSEKWAVYAILVLVLIIASFNMVGALSLLVLEKQKDMSILKTMGAQSNDVRNVFIAEGALWSLTGVASGLIIGLLLCIGQQQYQWVKMQGSFIIEAYPVQIEWTDFPLIIVTVLTIGILASWYPAVKAKRTHVQLRSN
jgi:lipoprotein-releasing system permease protein